MLLMSFNGLGDKSELVDIIYCTETDSIFHTHIRRGTVQPEIFRTGTEPVVEIKPFAGIIFFNGTELNHGTVFQNNIDVYSDWTPPMTAPAGINVSGQNVQWLWAGADNTNHFFTPEELFNPNESSPLFVNSLLAAGTTNSTYDRYTFYRLLSQLGTDSAPDSGKMNLNYQNVDTNGNVVHGMETNFIAWTNALQFFTNAADRLLRAYTTQWRNGNPTNFATTFYWATNFNFVNADQWTNYPAFGVGHIPVLVSNQFVYSSAVNRLLQLAANMYDATTNNFGVNGNNYNYPSVFRPTFWVAYEYGYTNVYINGYQQVVLVSGTNDVQLNWPQEVTSLQFGASTNNYPNGVNVYGVPWIIGAKKGFPNFNKFGLQNVVQITRKLQVWRSTIPTTTSTVFATNQLYVFSVSNSIGIECWNSYSNSYPNPVQIVARDNITMLLTNSWSATPWYFPTFPLPYLIATNIVLNSSWPGSAWIPFNGAPSTNSFIVPINKTVMFLTNSGFYFGTTPPGFSGFVPVGINPGWETNRTDYTIPQFGLLTTNRLQLFMLDGNHVIDYVQFAGPQSIRNLDAEFQTSVQTSGYNNMWSTALNSSGVPWGIINQIDESDHGTASDPVWSQSDPATVQKEIDGFSTFMGLTGVPYPLWTNDPAVIAMQTNYVMQVPCTPTVTAYEYSSWQANDPLVHNLASDLNFFGTEANGGPTTGTHLWTSDTPVPRPSFNEVNDRYQPWGAKMLQTPGVDVNSCNLAFKDPLVRASDYWDFPTNKFPTVGWLGRVHRGTPWQSVYLKAFDVLSETIQGNNIGTNTWVQWTGDNQLTYGQYFDAANTAPVQDRLLFDLFTTAFNDNAARGTLSVNQNHLAAWSALFSGVVAISNNAADNSSIRFNSHPQFQNSSISNTFVIIQPAGPAGINSPLGQLVNGVHGINNMRANFTNTDGLVGMFEHMGDILSVPQFAEQSPFLNLDSGVQLTNGISDEAYEMIPGQLLSLLRADSIGSITPANSQIVAQFTGYDCHFYAIEVSSNLVNWVSVSTNCPVNGMFRFTNSAVPNANQQFYRTILLQ